MRIKTEDRMDDNSSLSHQNGGNGGGVGGQLGGVSSGQLNQNNSTAINNKGNDDRNNPPNTQQYSIPAILHFIQHEWARFELERSQWDVDRAELQVWKLINGF